jgi:hypothetical protein
MNSALLVTHMTGFDIWFDCYEILLVTHADQVLYRLVIHMLDQVFGPQDE